MQRIILGLLLIVGAGGALVSGTTAFFSDTETSTGNTFTAGDIDLKIDNESYYNLNKCTEVTAGIWQWQGSAAFPIPGTPCETSFGLSDLDDGKLFFNFTDIKPDDEGEDTISIHAGSNDAYACMDVTLTSNDDNSTVDPETDAGDAVEDVNNTWDGELAQNLRMFWWADDGDNVLEIGEQSISGGVKTLYDLATTSGAYSVALADSSTNVWTPNTPGPIPGNVTKYIAKSWCFGNLTTAPIAQDGQGNIGTNGPQARGTGVVCDGSALNNITQTDGSTLDVAFRSIQSRNNGTFRCDGQQSRTAKITVIKQITNDNGGNNVVPDFQLFVDNGVTEIGVTSGFQTNVLAGSYTITETGVPGYAASFSGDCNASGQITLAPGDVKTCTITNNDLPANITLIKNVVNNNGGTATQFSNWGLRIDGNIVPNNSSVAVTANTPHSINEDGRAGYTFSSITGSAQCPLVLGGTATLSEGEAITCTITNDDN
ncbi:MAG: SipW-dependent-type signal peptide-containing protein [Minisyncoccia bacterium]